MPITIEGLPYEIIKYISKCKDKELELLKNKVFDEARSRAFEK